MQIHTFINLFAAGTACMLLFTNQTEAQVFKTQEEALAKVFANADSVARRTVYLEKSEKAALEKKSKSAFKSRIFTCYQGFLRGRLLGTAFFEKQIVRTKPALLMIVVTPSHTVAKVEILAFLEPRDYLPTARWFDLFQNLSIGDRLWPGRKIHAVSGATLSVRAFTLAVRRALAAYELITGGRP